MYITIYIPQDHITPNTPKPIRITGEYTDDPTYYLSREQAKELLKELDAVVKACEAICVE